MLTILLIVLLPIVGIMLFGIVYCSALLMAGIFEAYDNYKDL